MSFVACGGSDYENVRPWEAPPDEVAGQGAAESSASLSGQAAGAPANTAAPNAKASEPAVDPTYLPIHIRKLTNAEFANSVKDLLGLDSDADTTFAADVRNSFYTRATDARLDSTRADQLHTAAESLAGDAVAQRWSALVPCDKSQGTACAKQFISRFATRAFRRPASDAEQSDLLAVYSAAADGGKFEDGVQAVIEAVLQSGSFLYLSELGEGSGATRLLSSYETASALSYFLMGSPPDDGLLSAAAADELKTSDQRLAHYDRLVETDARVKRQLTRFIKEWLAIDQLTQVSPAVSGVDYNMLRPLFDQETSAFVEQVVWNGDGALSTLLSADFTMANATLGAYYGVDDPPKGSDFVLTKLASAKRRGIMQLGAFLSAHANRDNSGPVKRGVTLIRRLQCTDIQFPSGELAKSAMQTPVVEPNQTTRERFKAHSSDPRCAGCHTRIDPLGFAFENFDQAGHYRTQDNGKPVDASGVLVGTDIDGPYADNVEFAQKLVQSPTIQRCFARNVFRYAAALTSSDAEDTFLQLWASLPAAEQGRLLSIVRAYVGSDLFAVRSVP